MSKKVFINTAIKAGQLLKENSRLSWAKSSSAANDGFRPAPFRRSRNPSDE
jgi:hypothetical protein